MRHPVDYAPSQDFGENPTSKIHPGHPDYWIIERFGNYQPDGHTGTDYPCPTGTAVRAAADGTVLHVGNLSGTYADNPWWISPSFAGYVAVIDHGSFIGIYGHCQTGSSRVRIGQRVTEGEVFILSGNTGASTGAHLHFECLPDGYVLNSYMYGRINPATLFGRIQAQGTSTPIQEDELSGVNIDRLNEAVDRILGRDQQRYLFLDPADNRIKPCEPGTPGAWAARSADVGDVLGILYQGQDGTERAVSEVSAAYHQGEASAERRATDLRSLVSSLSTQELSAAIPDNFAQSVIDELAARLNKGVNG